MSLQYTCTNRVPEVIDRKCLPTGTQKIAECSKSNFSTTRTSKPIMPSKPKGSRREYLFETISAIIELKNSGQSHNEITHHFKIPKTSVTTILHRQARQSEHPLQPCKRPGHPPKLDARAQRAIIHHVEKFSHDNLNAAIYTIGRTTIRRYLKASGYFRFKAGRKLL